MPLSDHEQRMLDQIESALYAEDPKFASSVRGGDSAGAVDAPTAAGRGAVRHRSGAAGVRRGVQGHHDRWLPGPVRHRLRVDVRRRGLRHHRSAGVWARTRPRRAVPHRAPRKPRAPAVRSPVAWRIASVAVSTSDHCDTRQGQPTGLPFFLCLPTRRGAPLVGCVRSALCPTFAPPASLVAYLPLSRSFALSPAVDVAADPPLDGPVRGGGGETAESVAIEWGKVGQCGVWWRSSGTRRFRTGTGGGDECSSAPTRPSSTTRGGSHCPPSSAMHWQEG